MTGDDLLEFLRSRRSVRAFTPEPIRREVLVRLLDAATTAPSATNRQPWRFAVVTSAALRGAITAAVRRRTERIVDVVRRSHHGEDATRYLEYFFRPLETAQALVVPQYRTQADMLAELVESGGGDPAALLGGEPMQVELSAASAATMAMLLQARAEGLGACWMTGPMVAREDLGRLLGIAPPWHAVAVVALGHPAGPPTPTSRKPLSQVTQWFEDAGDIGSGEPETE